MFMAIAIGLGFGAAISFGLEMLDGSIKDLSELDKYGLPVICSIPGITSKAEIRTTRMKSLITYSFLIIAFMFVGTVILYLFTKGYIIL